MEIKFYLCNAKLFKTGSAVRIMTSNGQKTFVFRRSADKRFHQAINWVISYIPCGIHDKTICTTHFKPGGVSMNLLTTHKGVKHSSHILLSCNHNYGAQGTPIKGWTLFITGITLVQPQAQPQHDPSTSGPEIWSRVQVWKFQEGSRLETFPAYQTE